MEGGRLSFDHMLTCARLILVETCAQKQNYSRALRMLEMAALSWTFSSYSLHENGLRSRDDSGPVETAVEWQQTRSLLPSIQM